MKNWIDVVRGSDPDAAMTPERAQEMRRAVVLSTPAPSRRSMPWRLALAAAGLVMLLAGAGDDGRGPHRVHDDPAGSPLSGERRQIRFSTPGGTRVIWELNPEFTLRETLP